MSFNIKELREEAADLIDEECEKWNIKKEDLFSYNRSQPLVSARKSIAHALFVERNWWVSKIGRLLGRDHTTIIHHLRTTGAKEQPNGETLVGIKAGNKEIYY